MRGLLLKDYYMAIKYCRMWLVIIIVFGLSSFLGEGNTFMLVYPCIMSGMIPMTLLSYEERSHWNSYCETMPYTRKEVVASKYILALVTVILFSVMMTMLQCLSAMKGTPAGVTGVINLAALLWLIGIVGPCVLLPFIFKFGVENGRIVYYAVVAVLCICTAAVGIEAAEADVPVNMLHFSDSPLTALVMIAIGICIFMGSMGLAVKFYEQREL